MEGQIARSMRALPARDSETAERAIELNDAPQLKLTMDLPRLSALAQEQVRRSRALALPSRKRGPEDSALGSPRA